MKQFDYNTHLRTSRFLVIRNKSDTTSEISLKTARYKGVTIKKKT